MAESAMGLLRTLQSEGRILNRDCEIWYKGKYTEIVQLFSRNPVRNIMNIEELPKGISTLLHIRPSTMQQWMELTSLRDYFDALFPRQSINPGITVIKRVGKREYREHDELVTLQPPARKSACSAHVRLALSVAA